LYGQFVKVDNVRMRLMNTSWEAPRYLDNHHESIK
jgi:hypothetical protein